MSALCMYIYIYIYIHAEREREREREICRHTCFLISSVNNLAGLLNREIGFRVFHKSSRRLGLVVPDDFIMC